MLLFPLSGKYQFISRFYVITLTNILSCTIIPLAGFTSTVFLGHLTDIRYFAGASLGAILFDYIYFSVGFLRLVTTGMTAIAVGEDDREAMLLVGIRNSAIALGLGILILVIHEPLGNLGFALFTTSPEVKDAGLAYFNARIWGAPAVLLNYVLIGWFIGQEKSSRVLLMTIVYNVVNILQDYLYINQWHWASTGAGMSAGISQYLMLLTGLIFLLRDVPLKEVGALKEQILESSGFKSIARLNGNLFVRSLTIAFTYVIFSCLSTTMDTMIFAGNALLLQVLLLTIDIFNGVGISTAALTGTFKGEQTTHKYLPLLQIAIGTSLSIGLTCAGLCVLSPQTIFGLLTNHSEIIELIRTYVPWLLVVLGCASICLVLEGYFTGLAEGVVLRNTFLISTLAGFIPLAISTWFYHNNHMLWLAMSMFMVIRMVILGVYLVKSKELKIETILN
ncbi:MAG: guanitoxin biosynthesis MATE family efflux transporter GntT [Aphanizomenon sp.]